MKIQLKYYTLIFIIFSFLASCGKQSEGNEPQTLSKEASLSKQEEQSFVYNKQEVSQYLREWIDSTQLAIALPQITTEDYAGDLYAFYSERDYQPAWSPNKASELLDLLRNIDQEGINPASYPLDTLRSLMRQAGEQGSAETGARLDLLLSASYLKLADVIATGKVKPGDFYNSWHIKPQEPDTLYTHLQEAVSGSIDESLDYFRPKFNQYERLQQHLSRYSDIVDKGGWPEIAAGAALNPGDSSQRLEDIRQRLYLSGDLTTPPDQWQQPAYYDSSLVAAVNRYQARNGLKVEPAITSEMVENMNVPAEIRLKQILLNLDRIRWFASGEMDKTYVLVNLPEYRLRVFEEGEEIKNMRVVIGKQMHSTPIFSDKIEYIEFSPYWNVPTSIANRDIWPKARKNPNYLSDKNYEVFEGWGSDAPSISPSQIDWDNLEKYRIRQKPGPWNSLGNVKFMFPNEFAIYLHDTPEDQLFDRNQRAYSSGCIRIEEPDWMADWLLPQLNRQQAQAKMSDGRREVVQLQEKVPVYIFYLTSFEDSKGRLNFRKDLYELDKRLTEEFDVI